MSRELRCLRDGTLEVEGQRVGQVELPPGTLHALVTEALDGLDLLSPNKVGDDPYGEPDPMTPEERTIVEAVEEVAAAWVRCEIRDEEAIRDVYETLGFDDDGGPGRRTIRPRKMVAGDLGCALVRGGGGVLGRIWIIEKESLEKWT
jgi:hypothetical protein